VSAPCFSRNHVASSKRQVSGLAALIALAIFGVNDARADRIRATIIPPFLWTDLSQSAAQHTANVISSELGTIHPLGPGTFVGGMFSPAPPIHVSSSMEKTSWAVEAVLSGGSRSNNSSSAGSAGAGSFPFSTGAQIRGNAGMGPAISDAVLAGNSGAALAGNSTLNLNSDSEAQNAAVIPNPIPPPFLLFATGLGGLALLGWRKKKTRVAIGA
jgi:hypothetical protein